MTPFKKSCKKKDSSYRCWLLHSSAVFPSVADCSPRRCSSSHSYCIRKELFCDGRINCALEGASPPDETSCSLTAPPPESDASIWQDAGLPHFAGELASLLHELILYPGIFFGIVFLVVVFGYIAKNFHQKKPKPGAISELDRWLADKLFT